jgi:inositol oxygenase
VRCQLDAEEDVRRHNKLIEFYQNLGCHVKPNAKVQYINNNDGETYRKIPMQMALRPRVQHQSRRRQRHSPLPLFGGSFLPVRLNESSGRAVQLPVEKGGLPNRVDWLVLDSGNGRIMFRTTHGQFLRADPDGRCRLIAISDDDEEDEEEPTTDTEDDKKQADRMSFRLHRVSDFLKNDEFSSDESECEALSYARQKELWMLESAQGTFLAADPDRHMLVCSKVPAFWQADDETLSLTCTTDTPPRRQHYRKAWSKQTVAYVQHMRERYLSFSLKRMSIHEALDLLRGAPFSPFRIGHNRLGPNPSRRTRCYRTAEACRLAGHPDWVQFVALVHDLAPVLNFIDVSTAAESEDDYDWTISCRSRIVGCASPDETTFYEFRRLNADEKDSCYCSRQGMYDLHCGLENVLMAWTGPEYMYHMLRHNNTTIPAEGLAMLRYFSLVDWHSRGEYEHLTNIDDTDVCEFAAEFDQIRRMVRRDYVDEEDLSDEECDKLWNGYYSGLAAKYGLDGELMW